MTENSSEYDRLDDMGQFSGLEIQKKTGKADPTSPPVDRSISSSPVGTSEQTARLPKTTIIGLTPVGETADGRPIYPHLGGLTQADFEEKGAVFAPPPPSKIRRRRR